MKSHFHPEQAASLESVERLRDSFQSPWDSFHRKEVFMTVRQMNIEAEVNDIKQCLIDISKKLDQLISEREITAMMKLTEQTLSQLYKVEPDIYKVSDLKVKYR